ncbi:MAG: glycosyltransferase family 117 protein [Anaerolineae bacterium]
MSAIRLQRLTARLLPWAVFAAGLGLYIATLAPTVVTVFDDSPEFQLVCWRLGVAHPTGYPLYTLLGWLFTRLPFGDAAYRVNLLSAVCAAGALAGLFVLVREMTGRPLAGLLSALALAISPVFWSQATIAEVYALHLCITVWLLAALARWEKTGAEKWLITTAGLFGAGLAHHRTIVLLLPGLALALTLPARSGASRRLWWGRSWWKMALACLLPLLFYAYIPLVGARAGSLDGTYRSTWQGFWRHVLALDYSAFLTGNPLSQSRTAGDYLRLWLAQFGVVGGLAGVLGLTWSGRRPRTAWALRLTWLVCLAFAAVYRVADVEVFLLPAFLAGAAGIGLAFDWLSARVETSPAPAAVRSMVGILLALVLAGQALWVGVRAYPQADRSDDWEVHDWAVQALSAPLPQDAVVIGILGEMTVLRYYQETHGLRPDIRTIAADQEPARWEAIEEGLREMGEAYLTRGMAGLAERYHLDAAGPLIRVRPKPAPAENPTCAGVELLPGLCLQKWDITMRRLPGGWHAGVSLEWQALHALERDVRFSLRLLAGDGSTAAQHDRRPVHEAYPTTAWAAGETVSDWHDLQVPPAAAPGMYEAIIILYDPASGQEWARWSLGQVELPAGAS